jgi:hypothetical protein
MLLTGKPRVVPNWDDLSHFWVHSIECTHTRAHAHTFHSFHKTEISKRCKNKQFSRNSLGKNHLREPPRANTKPPRRIVGAVMTVAGGLWQDWHLSLGLIRVWLRTGRIQDLLLNLHSISRSTLDSNEFYTFQLLQQKMKIRVTFHRFQISQSDSSHLTVPYHEQTVH